MSGWDQFRLVARREVTESLRRRSVKIVLAILLLASTAGVLLPEIIGGGGHHRFDVYVSDRDVATRAAIADATGTVEFEIDLVGPADFTDDPRSARQLVVDGDVDAAVVSGTPATVLVRPSVDQELVALLSRVVGSVTLAQRLEQAGLDAERASAIAAQPSVRFESVQTADRDEQQGVASIAQLVLYLALLSVAMQVANGTAVEKASRISEVLLAIVRPGTLLFGKVIGVGIVSLAGVGALIAPVAVKAVAGGSIPASAFPAISASVVWFVLGAALYATIAGTLGSLVERQEEVGTAMQPIIIVLVATFILSTSTRESTVGMVLGLVPITSTIVEPARIALGVASAAEMVVSAGLLVVTALVAIRVGGAVYRRAIVRTGSRLKLREVVRS